MSQFSCPVVRIGEVQKHPNADSLSLTTVEGCPVIFRTGDYQPGDLAVYVPVEAVVPKTVTGTEFLGERRRIRAVKLRGIFSMGLLLPVSILPQEGEDSDGTWDIEYFPGEDMAPTLGITKWEEPEDITMQDEQAPAPKTKHPVPVYDVESWRKYGPFDGDPVVEVSEKIHGTNSRVLFTVDADGNRTVHVGSHRTWKKYSETNLWWKVAIQYGLDGKAGNFPGYVFYFETYGANVQDLPYGHPKGKQSIAIFDIFDTDTGRWLSVEEVRKVCSALDLPYVPVLFHGHLSEIADKLSDLAEGKSTIAPDQIKEGLVIKTVEPGYDNRYGRTILKLVSEQYLLRKGGTERH